MIKGKTLWHVFFCLFSSFSSFLIFLCSIPRGFLSCGRAPTLVDNRQISREPRYGLAEDRSSLSIHEARKDDAGLYTCIAKGYGTKNASRSVMVTVVCKYTFIFPNK